MSTNVTPYNASTMARIGDITGGIHVKTSTIANTTSLASGAYDIFTVYGRIRIIGLDIEAVTAFAADATLVKFRFTGVTPAVGVSDISANSLSIASIPVGAKVVWRGTAVNTAPDVMATQAGISWPTDWMDVGQTGGTGTITATSSVAAQSSGSCRFNIYYLPISEGAYVVALV
jgi:hypothetical protein